MGVEVQNPNPLSAFQNAAAAPKLIRASKTFTGAANLGAVGVNELFTTTGVVRVEAFYVYCSSDLVDAVDGAGFEIGLTNTATLLTNGWYLAAAPFDLDTIDAGWHIDVNAGGIRQGQGADLVGLLAVSGLAPLAISEHFIMTISAQAITGGTLQFFVLYRPLTSDGALTLGAGMAAI